MPWRPAMLRNSRVWARCDGDGRLLSDEGGRVEIRYKAGDGKAYRAALRNLRPLEGENIVPDDALGAAQPVAARTEARRGKPKAKASSTPDPASTPPESAIVAYTDGACSGNPGPAGLGVVLEDRGARRELSEYLGQATNNVAELTAIGRALEAVAPTERPIWIFTDSRYAIGVLTQGWKARANVALIQRLRERLASHHSVKLCYVPGHAGIAGNERADELARLAIRDRSTSGWLPS